jgi:hypothetical protein
MPRLIFTSLINKALAPFYASLIIVTSVLLLSKGVPIPGLILDYTISLGGFVRLDAYCAAQLLLFALSMSSTMGVTLGTTCVNQVGRPLDICNFYYQ